jgi:hypothetical protein
MLLALSTALLATGCQKQVKKLHIACQQTTGQPCMAGQWKKSLTASADAEALHPAKYWRYRTNNGKTAGVMLLGHPDNRLLAALQYSMFVSLDEVSDPKGFLASNVMYAVNPFGAQATLRFHRTLNTWDRIAKHLSARGDLTIHNASLVRMNNLIRRVTNDTQDAYQSSQNRTILYYDWKPKHGPVAIPLMTMGSPPGPTQLRLSHKTLYPARARSFGSLYHKQLLRKTLPLLQQLKGQYLLHNKKIEQLLYPARLRCKYMWYKLFQWKKKTIRLRRLHIALEQVNALNQKQKRLIYCDEKKLEKFKLEGNIIRKLRVYRQELIKLNQLFEDYVNYNALAQKRLTSNKRLQASVAIDGLLRGHTLRYTERVIFNGKPADPRDVFRNWQDKRTKTVWKQIHATAQTQGRYYTSHTKKQAGIFAHDNVVFWSKSNGDEYLISPHALIQGKFFTVLDRTRGSIEVITPYPAKPFHGKHDHKQTSQTSAQQQRPSIRHLIEQQCKHQKGLTVVRAAKADKPDVTPPEIPARSFLIQDGFLWIRLEKTMTVIPIFGANALKPAQQKSIVQQVEQAMNQRDAIAQHIRVIGASSNTPDLQITFPSDPPPKKPTKK